MALQDLIRFAELRNQLTADETGCPDENREKDLDELLKITDNLAHQQGYAECAYDLSYLKVSWEEKQKGGKQ